MKPLFLALGICSLFALNACNSGAGSGSEKDSTSVTDPITRTDSTAKVDPAQTKKDTVASTILSGASLNFLAGVANASQAEIKLGELAQQNAQNQRVKDFGAMMIRDHQQARQEVMTMTQGSNLVITDSLNAKAKKEYADLQSKKGAAFDKAYAQMMVKGHREVVNEFQKASKLPDASVKTFIDKTLPVIKVHLDSAQALTKIKS